MPIFKVTLSAIFSGYATEEIDADTKEEAEALVIRRSCS